MAKLENRVAVITASNSEIGPATAGEFVTEGAHVFIIGRRKEATRRGGRPDGAKCHSCPG